MTETSALPALAELSQSLLFLRDQFGIQLDYEHILLAGYSRFLRHGDVALDIGANEGLHALPLLNLVGPTGRLLAFEPNPEMAQLIRQKLSRISAPIELHEVAISEHSGFTSFQVAEGVPTESGLRQRKHSAASQFREISVRTEPLRTFTAKLSRLDYVKVDVEGADLDALKSGEADIRRLRPLISIEYGFAGYSVYGYDRRSLWDFAESLDYRLFTLFGHPLPTVADWMHICDLIFWDWYMVPVEKASTFPRLITGR